VPPVGLAVAVFWKLAPEEVVFVPVFVAFVVFAVVVVFLWVKVGWAMVVLRCIVVPVPKLAAVPLVVVIVMFALIQQSVIRFGRL
jgi:hypothetical protein